MALRKLTPQRTDKDTYKFRLWSPHASKLTLISIDDQREFEMDKVDGDYWESDKVECKPGFRYKYRIDGKDAFPDPASLSQPEGVHGPSELVQLSEYHWTDADWKGVPQEEMVIYELHVGTFSASNNFKGVTEKLDYLADLGVNTIEIMPVAQFSGERNWGYDGAYPFAVQSTYGGAFGLMELVDACHRKGIAVILDVVYNHLGPEGNYLMKYGPYFSDHYSTPWGNPLNFDGPHSDEVRNYFIQNALMWCRDFHIDGLRLDAVHAIYDFGATHFLRALKEQLETLGESNERDYILIAESNLNDKKYIEPYDKGGYGLDAQWADDFHHAIHALVSNEKDGYYMDYGDISHLEKAIRQAFVYDGNYSPFRKKSYGSDPTEVPAKQFVIFNQNHDQTGNRKHGERLIELTSFETAKLAAGVMLLSPYIPMLFMGEEYAERNPFLYFVSHEDDKLNRLVKKGRQQEFKDFQSGGPEAPDPAAISTFKKSMLTWKIEASKEKKAMHGFYQRLLEIRKNHPALKSADNSKMRVSESGGVLLIERRNDDHTVLIILNPAKTAGYISLPVELDTEYFKLIDSTAPKWLGADRATPERITAGDQVSSPANSIIAYTNYTKI